MIFYTIADRQKIMINMNQTKVIYLNEVKIFKYDINFILLCRF